jgi:polyvinyl alcohol dehydrogenase (cytochrome)
MVKENNHFMNGLYLVTISLLMALPGCGARDEPQTAGAVPGQQTQQASEDVMENLRGQKGGGEDLPGARLYAQHCAECHSVSIPRAPHQSFLAMLPGDMVLRSMTEGLMQPMAQGLSMQQKEEIAEFLAGSVVQKAEVPPVLCESAQAGFDFNQPPFAAGWGIDHQNTRFVPADVARLAPESVPKLELKWAFAYPNSTRARSQPILAGGTIVVGSQDGTVYSLNADTGCVRWTFRASAEVRTGITVSNWAAGEIPAEPPTAYFADLIARVYAVNLLTGELLWVKKVDDHPTATTTAQPVLYDGVLYQPVSSLEVVPAIDPKYECCTFRGSLVALNARNGELIWKSYTIEEEPGKVGETQAGTAIIAPSGAPVWNSPVVDVRRKRLYAGTGENYSSPAQGSSDAIIAFDMADGHIAWIRQTTRDDAWNVACMPFIEDNSNCPAENGPDVDYASPPILVRDNGGEILVAGQKSGDVYGIDPDDGAILWHQKLGRGGNQGGIHFGMAAGDGVVYVPMADYDDGMLPIEDARPGIHAVRAFTGEVLWSTPADDICSGRTDCDPGISAPATAIPGAVFAGHMDGRLRAYDAMNGKVLWEYDTYRDFETISGEIARGGSFGGGSGPIIANGRVYANSGYGLYFHMPGNVLLVFEAKD